MNEELKDEIIDIKNKIYTLSSEINQQFISLNENFSNTIDHLSHQIANLSNIQLVTNKEIANIAAIRSEEGLKKAQTNSKILDKYFIDYSYIKDKKYIDWIDNLNQYSKHMAECQHKDNNNDQIPNFCQSARKTIESAIIILFEKEYKYMSKNNTKFLEAYQRVKQYYDKREKSRYLPDIYIYNQGTLNAKHIKKIGENYIDWNKIEDIYKTSLPAAVRIVFETIRQDFYDASGFPHLRKNYLTILRMNELRQIQCHGSKDSIEVQLQSKISKPAQELFYLSDNFDIIRNSIAWFIKEVYNRLSKIESHTFT